MAILKIDTKLKESVSDRMRSYLNYEDYDFPEEITDELALVAISSIFEYYAMEDQPHYDA